MALQTPLKELYLRYLMQDDNSTMVSSLPTNNEEEFMTLPGTVEISKTGLKVSGGNCFYLENYNI